MFKLSFVPQMPVLPTEIVIKQIDNTKLEINGDLFDFSPLNDGDKIQRGSIPCDWIIGEVERIGDIIHVALLLPYSVAGGHVETPEPILVISDGLVELPRIDPVEEHLPEMEPEVAK